MRARTTTAPDLRVRLRAAWRRRFGLQRHPVTLLRLSPTEAILPAECACCGALASANVPETRRADGARLFVPYCTDCHFHVSALATRWLAGALASGLVGLTAALCLPLIGRLASVAYFLAVAVATLAPLALVRAWRAPTSPGHAVSDKAVWWTRDGLLACANEAWVHLLVRNAQATRQETKRLRVPAPWRLFGGGGLVLVVTPLAYQIHYPAVRILNLTDSRLTITIGSDAPIRIDPARSESPNAGIETRVAAGQVVLHVVDAQARVVEHREATIRSGTHHVYAPGATQRCFWLEFDQYGRDGATSDGTLVEPLTGQGPWPLDVPVDTWFGPNPTPSPDARSSGGRLVALRQAPCREAPAAVRARRVPRGSPDG